MSDINRLSELRKERDLFIEFSTSLDKRFHAKEISAYEKSFLILSTTNGLTKKDYLAKLNKEIARIENELNKPETDRLALPVMQAAAIILLIALIGTAIFKPEIMGFVIYSSQKHINYPLNVTVEANSSILINLSFVQGNITRISLNAFSDSVYHAYLLKTIFVYDNVTNSTIEKNLKYLIYDGKNSHGNGLSITGMVVVNTEPVIKNPEIPSGQDQIINSTINQSNVSEPTDSAPPELVLEPVLMNATENISSSLQENFTNASQNITHDNSTISTTPNEVVPSNVSNESIEYNGSIPSNESIINESITNDTIITQTINASINFTNETNISSVLPQFDQATNACVDTCDINIDSSGMQLLVETGDGPVFIGSLDYDIIPLNHPPVQTIQFDDIYLSDGQNISLNLSAHFLDPDNDTLLYDTNFLSDVKAIIAGDILTLSLDNLSGPKNITMFIYATDHQALINSNTFVLHLIVNSSENNTINASVNETIQYQAEIGKPVKWVKKIRLDDVQNSTTLALPKDASGISVIKLDNRTELNITNKILGKSKNSIQASIQSSSDQILTINDSAKDLDVYYYTSAPIATEKTIGKNDKQVVISSNTHYKNILSYSKLPQQLHDANAIKLRWTITADENLSELNLTSDQLVYVHDNGFVKIDLPYIALDTDNDSLYDTIQWITPSLSNQTFDIILISNADLLDSNRTFIESIYDNVSARDDIWASIPAGNYVRVTFIRNLTSQNDITLYAKSNYSGMSIEVYEQDKNNLIAKFNDIQADQKYRILLDQLSASNSVFDLKITGASNSYVDMDYIVDPTIITSRISPTPTANTTNNLLGFCNATDNSINRTAYNYTWYNNGVVNDTGLQFYGGTLGIGGDGECAIRSNDSRVVCWGDNSHGFIGDNGATIGSTTDPVRIYSNASFNYLARGLSNNMCAIRMNDSRMMCWGRNSESQVSGDGAITGDVLVPTDLKSNYSWLMVTGGNYFTCGIRANDSLVFCWGENNFGQIGVGDPNDVYYGIAQVNDSSPYLSITAKENHICGIRRNDSRILCWGENIDGVLGNGTAGGGNTLNPTLIKSNASFKMVSTGVYHTCALRANDSKIMCWGDNTYGQLGDGTVTAKYIPTQINSTVNVSMVVVGGYQGYAMRASDNKLMAWGLNDYNQLGDDAQDGVNQPSPLWANSTVGYSTVGNNGYQPCGIRINDSKVTCWGVGWGFNYPNPVNDVIMGSAFDGFPSGQEAFVDIMSSQWLTNGSNWIFSCNAYNKTAYSGWTNSTVTTIGTTSNSNPSISFVSPTPSNGTITASTSFIINISINTTSAPMNNFTWNWNGTNYPIYDPTLLLMYNFDNVSYLGEGINNFTNDASNLDMNGTCRNGAAVLVCNYTSGVVDSGIKLDGLGNFVEINWTKDYFVFNNSNFSVEAWVNVRGNDSDSQAIVSHMEPTYNVGWLLGLNPSGHIIWGFNNESRATEDTWMSGYTLVVGQWYHLVLTINTSIGNATLYVNGAYNSSMTLLGQNLFRNTSGVPRIGAMGVYNGPYEFFNGTIDEVRIWNRTLGSGEIQQHYYSSLNKFASDGWYFFINETNLTNGTYTYYGFVNDTSGDSNITATNYLTITGTAYLSSCTSLSAANTLYYLANNVSINGSDCFDVTAENVTLDCQGNNVTGNYSPSTFGVYSNKFNTYVKNCNIKKFDEGIRYLSASNGTIDNVTINSTIQKGISLISTNNVVIKNSKIYNNTYAGIYLSSAIGTTISNVYASTNTSVNYGGAVYVEYSANTVITNVTANASNSASAGLAIFYATNNTIVSNSTLAGSSNHGIWNYCSGDPCNNNTIFNSVGSSVSTSGIFLTTSSSNNQIINSNGTSNSDVGIYVAGSNSNTIINSTGRSNSNAGINIDTSLFNVIINSTGFSNISNGIVIWYDNYTNVTNSMGNATSGVGIYVYSGLSNIIYGSNGTSSSNWGIFLDSGSSYNQIINSSGNSNSDDGIHLRSSSYNQIINTTGFSNSVVGIYLESSSGINITNSVGTSNSGSGIVVDTSSNNLIINSNGSSNSNKGIDIYWTGSYNQIINSNGTSNSSTGILIDTSSNNTIINSTGTSSSEIGIGLSLSTYNNITGSTGRSKSYVGIFLATSSNYNTVTNSIGNGTGSDPSGNNVGIFVSSSNNNKIANSTAQANNSAGLRLDKSYYTNVSGSTIISNSNVALLLLNSSSNTFTGINASATSDNAIDLYPFWDGTGASNNNNISNSIAFSQNTYPVLIDTNATGNILANITIISGNGAVDLLYIQPTASHNTFYWINFTPTTGYFVNDNNGSNYYNTTISGHTEGNIYANVINGSVNIKGPAISQYGSGLYYGTQGSGYPYNSSNSQGKLSGRVYDYGPLTNILNYSAPGISFNSPTPVNNFVQSATYVVANISLNTTYGPFGNITWNWNGTNYTIYDPTLLLMYNFDNVSSLGEGNNNFSDDQSIYGNNGTCLTVAGATRSCSWAAGKYGNALDFAGAGGIVDAGSPTSLTNILNKTICAWINPRTWGTKFSGSYYGTIASKGFGSGTAGWIFYISNESVNTYGLYYVQYTSGGVNGQWKTPNASIVLNQWNHVCVTYNRVIASNASLFINGVNLTVFAQAATGTIPSDAAYHVDVGDMANVLSFNGTIDEIRIWNRTLSGAEIQQQYYSNLNRYEPDGWSFYVNESNLTYGTYTYYGYANSTQGQTNQTETRTVIIRADAIPPNVSLIRPANGTYVNTPSQSFQCNLTDNVGLYNVTFYLWNSSGGIVMTNTTLINGTINSSSWVNGLPSVGTFYWNCLAFDNSTNYAWNNTGNFTITLDNNPGISFNTPTLPNASYIKNASYIINISVNNVSNIGTLIYDWNGTNYTMYSNDTLLMYNFDNISSLGEGSGNGTFDASINGFNGTCMNDLNNQMNCNWTTGRYGYALKLDGNQQSVAYYDYLSNLEGSNNHTFEAWFYTNSQCSISNCGTLFHTGNWVSGTNRVRQIRVNGTQIFTTYYSNDWYYNVTVPLGSWNYIAWVYNGSNETVYLNGVLVGSRIPGVVNTTSLLFSYVGAYVAAGLGVFAPFNGSIDEVRVWNRTFTAAEITQHYNSNLNRYSSTGWSLYVNQTGLVIGNYTYYGYVLSTHGLSNITDLRFIQFFDTPPNVTNVRINPGVAYANNSLVGYCTATDYDLDNVTYYYQWWLNSTFYSTGITSQNFTQGIEINIANITASAITKGQNWTMSCRAFDGTLNSSWVNSSQVTIQNSPPIIQTASLAPSTAYANDTLKGSCMATDTDNDTMKYYYIWYLNGAINLSSNTSNIFANGTTYNVANVTTPLVKGQNWTFSCQANDTVLSSSWLNSSTVAILNSPPVSTSRILPNPSTTNETLRGYCNASDNDLDNLTHTWRLYLNTALNTSGVTNNFTRNTEVNVVNISSSQLYVWQNWTLECKAFDSFANATRVNSSNDTVGNYLYIAFVGSTPANNTVSFNTTILVNMSIITLPSSNLSKYIWNWNGTNYTIYDPSLVLQMNFDNVSALGEGNNNFSDDESIYGNNGTCYNMGLGCNYTTGKYGKGISFDGVSAYVQVNHTNSLNLTQNLTLEAWIYEIGPPNTNHATGIISKDNGMNNGQYELLLYTTGVLVLRGTAQNIQFAMFGNTNLNNSKNIWHHVVVTFNGSIASFYVDGQPDGVTAGSDGALTMPLNSTTGIFAIGVRGVHAPNPSSSQFNGTIDEVRVYNRVLSAAEIQQQYYSNLNKYSLNSWQFYANESLVKSVYTYYGYANDSSGNYNYTDLRTYNMSESAPTIISSRISPTTLYATSSVLGYCNASDAESNTLTYNYIWYLNGVLNTSGATSSSYSASTEINIANISTRIVKGQNWTLSCNASDSILTSSWLNSSISNVQNSAPVIQTSTILPSLAYANASLIGYCNATDVDSDLLAYSWLWWRNNTFNASGNTSFTYTAGLQVNIANISSSSLVINDNWTFSCMANDSPNVSSWLNSTTIVILSNIPEKVTLVSPTNNNYTLINRTPLFIWNPSNFTTYYEINITSAACPNVYGNATTGAANITSPSELCVNDAPGAPYYNWTVRACGLGGCGQWSNVWNFSVQPYLAVTIVNNSVNFSTLGLGQNANTESYNPGPFVFRNDGNVYADMINISANQSLWTTPGAGIGTRYMQIRASNSSQSNTFNNTGSLMTYVNLSNFSSVIVVKQLNYNGSRDQMYLHMNVTVPGGEPPGTKYNSITFTWMESS